jgi:hypothetical protein
MKLEECKRLEYVKELAQLRKEKTPKEECIKILNEKYNATYKVGSFRYLYKCSFREVSTKRIEEHNRYMEKCRKELQDTKELPAEVLEAERLFALSRGLPYEEDI